MNWLLYLSSALILIAVYANVVATVGLWNTTGLARSQQIVQGIIVWLVPFFGAWLILHLLAVSEPQAISRRMFGSRGLGWYIIAGAYDGPWRGGDTDSGADFQHATNTFEGGDHGEGGGEP